MMVSFPLLGFLVEPITAHFNRSDFFFIGYLTFVLTCLTLAHSSVFMLVLDLSFWAYEAIFHLLLLFICKLLFFFVCLHAGLLICLLLIYLALFYY